MLRSQAGTIDTSSTSAQTNPSHTNGVQMDVRRHDLKRTKKSAMPKLQRARSESNLGNSEYNVLVHSSQLAIIQGLRKNDAVSNLASVHSQSGSDSEELDMPSPPPLTPQILSSNPPVSSLVVSSPIPIPGVHIKTTSDGVVSAESLAPPLFSLQSSVSPMLSASAPLSASFLGYAQNKSLEDIKDEIANRLKARIGEKSSLLDITEDNGAIRRAVSHIIGEMIEVIAWTPLKRLSAAQLSGADDESKEVKSNVIIHYKQPFYNSMYTAAKLAAKCDYDAGRVFHKREPVFSIGKKEKFKHPKALNEKRPVLPLGQMIFEDASVIIPICIGFDGALTGDELEDTLRFYQTNKAKEITVYIGEYNRLEDPVDRLDAMGKEKREHWEATNKAILEQYGAKTLLLETLAETDAYKNAKAFVQEKFNNNNELKYSSVMDDAEVYMVGRKKPSTPQAGHHSEGIDSIPEMRLDDSSSNSDYRFFVDRVIDNVLSAPKGEATKKMDTALVFISRLREVFGKKDEPSHKAVAGTKKDSSHGSSPHTLFSMQQKGSQQQQQQHAASSVQQQQGSSKGRGMSPGKGSSGDE